MEKNEITIKVNLETTEAMQKLEELKKQLQDVLELQNKLS